MKYSYSAIIPVHNAEENILDLILSLKKLKDNPSQIIVVDDASSDNTNTLINKLEGISLITLKDNVGAASARNIGAEKATSEWLLFIDSDCILPPSSIKYAFPSNIEFKKGIVGRMGVFSKKKIGISPISDYKNMQRHFEIIKMNNPPGVFCSSCFTITKQAYLKCGGFNENFGKTPTEDNEFYFRLTKKNLFIKYNALFGFNHNKKMSIFTLFGNDLSRSKAIILNLFNQLGEKRDNLTKIEIIQWFFELAAGFLLFLDLIYIPFSFLENQFIFISFEKSFFCLCVFSVIISLINKEFFKYSFGKGGIKLLISHIFLRCFEMFTACIGITLGIFELVFVWISMNKRKKIN